MTEEAVPVAAPVVDAAPVVAPVESAPVVTEVAPAAVQAEVVQTVSEQAPAPLLAQPEEATTVESAPVVEEAKTEPSALPVYEFKLPEGAQEDNPIFKSFQSKLGEFQNLSKVEQTAMQKLGQDMIDMHQQALASFAEQGNKAAWDMFKNRNSEWLEKAKSDPSIGGDNWDSTLGSAQQAISLYGGNKPQQLEVAKLFQDTGAENHPALLRFLSNVTKIAAKEGTPVVSRVTPIQKPGNIAQAMYGNTSKAS